MNYWITEPPFIEYSPYGSKNKINEHLLDRPSYKERMKRQEDYKNSPNFYQEAPFLTIAEDLLKLIKEDKVEKLIFLSAYDKRKFPNSDERKREVFRETFLKLSKFSPTDKEGIFRKNIRLQLIGFV